MKFNALPTNALFHNALDTKNTRRFGEFSTHELGIQPEAYDPKLDVEFARLRSKRLTVERFGEAAWISWRPASWIS